MGLKVKKRKDTGTLWITGTITLVGMTRGFRLRKRAISNDYATAALEAADIEREMIFNQRAYPALSNRGRSLAPLSWGKHADPTVAKSPVRKSRGYWSPSWFAAGITSGASPDVWMYAMESSGKTKVGLTANIRKRLAEITASSAVAVTLFAHVPVRADVAHWAEYLAHTALSEVHSHAEWFSCSGERAMVAVEAAIKRAEKISETWMYAGNDPSKWRHDDDC